MKQNWCTWIVCGLYTIEQGQSLSKRRSNKNAAAYPDDVSYILEKIRNISNPWPRGPDNQPEKGWFRTSQNSSGVTLSAKKKIKSTPSWKKYTHQKIEHIPKHQKIQKRTKTHQSTTNTHQSKTTKHLENNLNNAKTL